MVGLRLGHNLYMHECKYGDEDEDEDGDEGEYPPAPSTASTRLWVHGKRMQRKKGGQQFTCSAQMRIVFVRCSVLYTRNGLD